jgi:A/G-specific adenine glycosylase
LAGFSAKVIKWQQSHGRHDLPWQIDPSPYKVYVSEIMLQQTQVTTVIPFFIRFVKRFPDIKKLARAHEDTVMSLWSGLGYYRRAINLHRSAKIILKEHRGLVPDRLEALLSLPGVGDSTAGAILSLGYQKYGVITDGNVRRLFARHFMIGGDLTKSPHQAVFMDLTKREMPEGDFRAYSQGVMDLGATVCTKTSPSCGICPLNKTCLSYQSDSVNLYPVKAKKKSTTRAKNVYGLLLLNKEAKTVYLQKRDRQYFWPGRYCIPLFDNQRSMREFIKNLKGAPIPMEGSAGNILNFKFSHMNLILRLVHYATNHQDSHFLSRDKIITLDIPKKIKRTIIGGL